MQEMGVQSLGGGNLREEAMATHSSILNPMDRGAWMASPWGGKVGHNLATEQQQQR